MKERLHCFLRMHTDPLFWAIFLVFVTGAVLIVKATS